MTNISTKRERPTSEEVEAVKAEGHSPGWLRSRFMGQPWPREGVSACGRPHCEICDQSHGHMHMPAQGKTHTAKRTP
jgi:hypothetical protein